MRMKDVVRDTGLSEWTVRYYMKEGLVSPQEKAVNGRARYEFSPADVDGLRAVVGLRAARFTMEEIRTLQREPERMPEILSAYTRRIRDEETELHRLNQALETLDSSGDYISLSQAIQEKLTEHRDYVPELRFGALDAEDLVRTGQRAHPRGGRRQLAVTIACIAAALILGAAGTLLWRHIQSGRPTDTLDAGGYVSMETVDGTCYLADSAGVVYTLDLETGKRTLAFSAPGDVAWRSDPAMETLYYFRDQILYAFGIASGQSEAVLDMRDGQTVRADWIRLYSWSDVDYSRRVAAVTDHYVLIETGRNLPNGGWEANWYVWGRETGELRQVMDGSYGALDSYRAVCDGDVVYLTAWEYPEADSAGESRAYLAALDLSAGSLRELPFPENSAAGAMAVAADGALIVLDETTDTVLRVEPESGRRAALFSVPSWSFAMSNDGTLLAAMDPSPTPEGDLPECILYRLNPEAGNFQELARFPGCNAVRAVETDGSRVALWGLSQNTDQIRLYTLPE